MYSLENDRFLHTVEGVIEINDAAKIAFGVSTELEIIRNSIIKSSRQKNILEKCPDDMHRRFTNSVAMAKWALENETRIISIRTALNLAGIVFFRKKQNPYTDCDITFGIRLYEGYTGHGLAVPFMNLAHDWLKQNDDYNAETGVWLTVDASNPPAIAAYEKFGYVKSEAQPSEKRVLMEYYCS